MYEEFRPLVIKAGNTQIADGQRVRVQGSKNMTLISDFFLFDIYNISDEDMASVKYGKMMYAYGEGGGLLCCGEIDDIYNRAEGVNTITTISVIDGKSFWETRVNKSIGGGSNISDVFRGLVQNASVGAFVAPDYRMIRGQTYTGRLADSISMLAKSVHSRAFITNNTVYITQKGRASETVNILDDEIIDDRNNANGMRVIKTVVKGIPMGAIVVVENKKYRLVSQKINADNFKGAWESVLVLVDETQLGVNGMEGG